ncbi:MAG: GEVED domain-containing protein [Spirosomataceae bacterium]
MVSNQYTLNCGPTVTGINVPSNLTGGLGPSGLSLTFTDNSSNETGFIIERSTTSTTEGFVPVGGVAPNITTYLDPTTTAFTTYYYRVKASNSSNQYSTVFTITTALNYCIPTYSNSCNSIAVVIDDFILKEGSTTLISNINSNCSSNNYGDFTNTTYNLTAGNTYTFTARAVSGGSGTYFDQHVSIWLDFDQDGLFELNERVYRSDSLSMPRMNPTATGSFTIPNNASGIIRMRVRSSFNSGSGSAVTDPCGNLIYGETEDYQLNVSSVLPSTITTGVVSPNPVCAGQNISVPFTTSNLSSSSFVVQLSDANGTNFANITTTGTSSPLIATIPFGSITGSGYQVRVNSLSPNVVGSPSTAFTINAIPNPPSATSPINYCQNQTPTPLTASGSNLKWYTTASGNRQQYCPNSKY